EIPAQIHSDEYYVNMMIAWFFATALAKQWDSALPYLEAKKLDTWVHNKTIQKARESYRITAEQKLYLKSLKQQ
ncbi:MAG: DNA alkylation repair protein, partial [Lancefieldella rimae]|nr:DNA alkylation repair protein [Lancefieldella rimae]